MYGLSAGTEKSGRVSGVVVGGDSTVVKFQWLMLERAFSFSFV